MILDALEEVLFWDNIPLLMNFTAENLKRYHPHDYEGYRLEKEKFLQKQIPTKDAFVHRLEYYLDKGKPLWVSGRSAQVDELTGADLERTFQIHLTAERARQTAEKVEGFASKDADFYGFYTDNALHTKENRVLDLTVGLASELFCSCEA